MRKTICPLQICSRGLISAILVMLAQALAAAQGSAPPSPPTGLTAATTSCGQVNLSWSPAVDNSGTGLQAYSVWRNDGGVNTVTSIGAARTWFDDTINVKSSTTMSYYVLALDNSGNQSLPSNTITVSTPPCSIAAGEQIGDDAYVGPLGKSIATFGTQALLLYQQLNLSSQRETWVYVRDSATGQSSTFRLHAYPGFTQIENGYLLISSTELWTIANSASSGGLTVNQYRLNGTPPTSATLLSTQALGDSRSAGQFLIKLQSGALLAGWSEQGVNATDLTTGFAYRSPTGSWISHFPLMLPNGGFGGDVTIVRMAAAQHPSDGSVWTFVKRDSFSNIAALRFTETTSDINVEAVTPGYITQNGDGNNGPESEFPYLVASPDPTRNAILLAYQNQQSQFVFIDPLYGSLSNNIFLKQARISIAQISPSGAKTFIPFGQYVERITQFGMSVLSDGSIWLAYQPINAQSLTWNAVYASVYQNDVWNTPVLTGLDYNNYNQASGLPVSLVYAPEQPLVAFMAPDQKVHTFDLLNLGAPPADTTTPTISISTPAVGASLSGSSTISATASDDVGVRKVEILLDGSIAGTLSSAPYTLLWDTTRSANGSHTIQAKAYDAAGNVGVSTTVSVNVNNSTAAPNLSVSIITPKNGSAVPRNQKVTISAAAADTVAVTKMEFYVNNSLLGTAIAAPFNYPWKVPGKRGTYNIRAKAYDAMGNSASQAITVSAQ